MVKPKIRRFAESRSQFICPVCKSALSFSEGSFSCAKRHCFDVSKYGYVNLLKGSHNSKHYSRDSFAERQDILEKGYYRHIADGVIEVLSSLDDVSTVLDSGCGEGYYARLIQSCLGLDVLAFDISKDAIQIAAKSDSSMAVKWFVGDSFDIPIANGAIDCVLDVFAPSNHAEFDRVLRKGGYVVKVIPGSGHLAELRELAKDQLRSKEYSNHLVVDNFEDHIEMVSRRKVSKTFEMPLEDIEAFAAMTPVLFSVDMSRIDLASLKSLTVEAEILVGKRR